MLEKIKKIKKNWPGWFQGLQEIVTLFLLLDQFFQIVGQEFDQGIHFQRLVFELLQILFELLRLRLQKSHAFTDRRKGKKRQFENKINCRKKNNNKTYRDMSRCCFGMLILLTLFHQLQFFLLAFLLLLQFLQLACQPCLLVHLRNLDVDVAKKINEGNNEKQ